MTIVLLYCQVQNCRSVAFSLYSFDGVNKSYYDTKRSFLACLHLSKVIIYDEGSIGENLCGHFNRKSDYFNFTQFNFTLFNYFAPFKKSFDEIQKFLQEVRNS